MSSLTFLIRAPFVTSLVVAGILPVFGWSGSLQVTFTGQIGFTFDAQFGGPSFHGIEPANSFSAVLTFDPAQPNQGTVQNGGQYGAYDFTVTVQTMTGPVSVGGPISWPCPNCGDYSIRVDPPGTVNSAGVFVAFDFVGNSLVSSDDLANVNWQDLVTQSRASHGSFTNPAGSPVSVGFADMFLRAPNAAVVVVGGITDVTVQELQPTPEPVSASLLLIGLCTAPLRPRFGCRVAELCFIRDLAVLFGGLIVQFRHLLSRRAVRSLRGGHLCET